MRNKNIVVTGGAGFIGSRIANALSDENNVWAYDNGYLGTPENLRDRVEYIDTDVRGGDIVPEHTDIVFHLAALSSYQMHEDRPREGADVNVTGFINVMEQAVAADVDAVVYATTSSIYGDRTEPTSEDVDVTVKSAYEASKRAREEYAQYYTSHHDISCAGLRLFSVYEGFDGGEEHKGEFGNIISQFADKIARDESPVIYGDGTQTRDFVHVDDVIDAFRLAAEEELSGIYNVGTGESYSFNRVVSEINSRLGTDVSAEYVENPIPEDVYVHDTCADYEKFQEATGWRPVVDFTEGVRDVCSSYEI